MIAKADLVTIGITCYNAEATIGRALASAQVQDWPNLEIVVADDASTDGSVAIVKAACNKDARIRLLRLEANIGPAGARNAILAAAHGEFVAFFDDDDESLPQRISSQIQHLVDYEQRHAVSLVACYASGSRRYANGYTLELPAIGSRGDEAPNGTGLADYLLIFRRRENWFYGSGTPACSLMARSSTFAAIGGFDASMRRVEDADLAVRLGLSGGHCVGTPEPLFIQYSTQAADKSPARNLEAEQILATKNRDYLQSIGCYYYALHWPELRYWHFTHNYPRFMICLAGLMLHNPWVVMRHLFATGPRRLAHEWKMRQKKR